MEIHNQIRESRKRLGITQEQLANYLNVSTPAVNKWENGVTYPDITLLAPLARLLKMDLNTLMGFNEKMTETEIGFFLNEVSEKLFNQGYEFGYDMAMQKISEYPNNLDLIYNAAILLDGSLHMIEVDEEKRKIYEKEILKFLQRVADSDDAINSDKAKMMLVSKLINDNQFIEAQEMLNRVIEKDSLNKYSVQATLWINENKLNDAAKLLEWKLYEVLSENSMILDRLAHIALLEKDEETALLIQTYMSQINNMIGTNTVQPELISLQLSLDKKDKQLVVESLKKIVDGLKNSFNISRKHLFKHIEFRENENERFVDFFIKPILKGLKEDPQFEFMKDYEEFILLIKELEFKYN